MAPLIMKVLCVAVVCMAVISTPVADQAFLCSHVNNVISPCITYLVNGGTPPAACCDDVKWLVLIAKTTTDKQTICNCLKGAARKIPGFNYKNAETLPSQCKVNFPFKISPDTDCSTINF